MKEFSLWGLVAGLVCAALYVGVALWRKKPPLLGDAVGMLASGFGLVGALKIFWFVFSGELIRLIDARPADTATSISADDMLYFVAGGFTLAWVAVEAISKRLKELFQ